MITHKEVTLPGAPTSRTQGQTRPPRERSVTETNTNGSVWQGNVVTVGPAEMRPEGSACHPEATEVAGMKPLPQTQAKATHAAMTITQAQRSEGNRGPGCRSSRVPARMRGSMVPARMRSSMVPARMRSSMVPARMRSGRVPARMRSGRVPARMRSGRVPARMRSGRVPARTTVRRSKEGRVDPNREVRGKATEARSRLFASAKKRPCALLHPVCPVPRTFQALIT